MGGMKGNKVLASPQVNEAQLEVDDMGSTKGNKVLASLELNEAQLEVDEGNAAQDQKTALFMQLWENTDSIRESRSNFFLLAESIFIISFYTSTITEKEFRIVLCIFAMVFTLSWWINILRLSQRIDWVVKTHMLQKDEIKAFLSSVHGIQGKIQGKWIISSLPVITLVFWLVLFVLLLRP